MERERDRLLPLSPRDDDELSEESDDAKDATDGTLKKTPSVSPSSVCFLPRVEVDAVVGLDFWFRLVVEAPTRLSMRLRIMFRISWNRLDFGVVDVIVLAA